MGLTFIYAWAAKTEQARKAAFLVWLIACVGVARVWYLYNMATGKYEDGMCSDEVINQVNESGVTETLTVEECNFYAKTQWIDLFLGWAFDIYFATVIKRWSQNIDEDSY